MLPRTMFIPINNTIPTIIRYKGRIINKITKPYFVRPYNTNASNTSNTLPTSKVLKPISPDISTVSCTIIDFTGTVRAVSKKFPRSSFLQQNKLFPRDLRKIDATNVDVAPSIAVRSNGILINLLHIKALIKRNEVLIFDTASSKSAGRLSLFMYDLENKMRTKVVHGGMLGVHGQHYGYNTNMINQNYEFKALECILVNVMAVLESELRSHLDKLNNILKELDSQIDRANLKDLLVYSKALTMFYQKSLLIRNTLDELLDNDEDLENMYLTENYEIKKLTCDDDKDSGVSSIGKSKNSPVSNNNKTNNHKNVNHTTINDEPNMIQQGSEVRDTGEVEMLLESYYKQCDEIVQQAETMINDIKSTEDIVNIILDANRNSLMVFELRVAIFTLGITIATLLPAFYGMNLKNYIENSNIAFGSVVALSAIAGGSMCIVYLRRLHAVKRMTMVSSKQLDKFDVDTKKGLLESIRGSAGKTGGNSDGNRKLQKEVVWKWLIGKHR